MGGRKPQPVAVLKAKGHLQHDPQRYAHRLHEPKSGELVKPRGLSGATGKKFLHVKEVMEELGVADAADRDLAQIYAETWVAYQTILNSEDPNYTALNALRTHLLKMMSEMGLTPVARTKLAKPTDEEEDPLKVLRMKRDSA